MIKDKFFGQILISFMLLIVAGMAFKGLMYWWIPLLIMFVLIGFYAEREAEKDADKDWPDTWDEQLSWPNNWEDYKSQYEAPDECNTGLDDKGKCCKCGNKVYKICMCKPINKK